MRNLDTGLKKFIDQVITDDIKILKSDVVEDELIGIPDFVRKFVHTLPKKNIQHIELSEEAIWLAEQYITENVVGKASRADCFHIAITTLRKVDLLVSWNFKHIVNIKTTKKRVRLCKIRS